MLSLLLTLPFQTGPSEDGLPTTAASLAPRLTHHVAGPMATWLEADGDGFALRGAVLDGANWRAFATPAVRSTNLFVNWADTPGIRQVGDGLVAHWLEMSADGTYTYDVRLARSDDGGANWRPLGTLHTDVRPAEHGFVSWVDTTHGARAFWLDGRATTGGHDDEGSEGHGHGAGAMQLRTAHVSDAVRQEQLLDEDVCDCCPTAAIATPTGPLVAYRDRVVGDEIRDIAIVRWLGDRWSDPIVPAPDGWQIAGCPVNGPALAAEGELIVLAWFTGHPTPRVRLARSLDGGTTWEDAETALEADASVSPRGRVALAFDSSGGCTLVSLADVGEVSGWFAQAVDPIEGIGEPRLIRETSPGRESGMPGLQRATDGTVLFVHTLGPRDARSVQVERVTAPD